jgi:structural maintenance of chromosome 2
MIKLESRKEKIISRIKEVTKDQETAKKDLSSFENKEKNSSKILQNLKEKFNWIESDKQYFGKPGTEYDFSKVEPSKLNVEIIEMKKESIELKRIVNFKIDLTFEKTQKLHNEMIMKKEVTTANKEALEDAIKGLEKKSTRTSGTSSKHCFLMHLYVYKTSTETTMS